LENITAGGAGEGVASEANVIVLPGESFYQDNACLSAEKDLEPDHPAIGTSYP